MEWTKFLDFITKPVPVITSFALVFCTGFLLFAPDRILAQLGLTHALLEYRGYIGIGFVFFMSWLVVTVVSGTSRSMT